MSVVALETSRKMFVVREENRVVPVDGRQIKIVNVTTLTMTATIHIRTRERERIAHISSGLFLYLCS